MGPVAEAISATGPISDHLHIPFKEGGSSRLLTALNYLLLNIDVLANCAQRL